jgi:hypothetical protein
MGYLHVVPQLVLSMVLQDTLQWLRNFAKGSHQIHVTGIMSRSLPCETVLLQNFTESSEVKFPNTTAVFLHRYLPCNFCRLPKTSLQFHPPS